MKNEVLFDLEKVKAGMEVAYKTVSQTMGACGRNVIFRSPYSGNPVITNDGVSIMRRINLKDEAEQMGVELLRQVAQSTVDEAGDGTSTSILLAYEFISKGLEIIKDTNPMILKGQIDTLVKDITTILKDKAVKAQTKDELFNVANISVENEEIASLISDAVIKVGLNGAVLVEESNGTNIEREDVSGFQFNKGYISPYFMTDVRKRETVLENVPILVLDKDLIMNTDYLEFVKEVYGKRQIKEMLIVGNDLRGEALNSFIKNRLEGGINYTFVSKQNMSAEEVEDLAIYCGARVINQENTPGTLAPAHFNYLGKARKVVVGKDNTIIIGGEGKKEDVENRITFLKEELEKCDGEYRKGQIKERIARIAGEIVTIKVGASTEAGMRYLKDKIDDAVSATKVAQEDGVVIGGGKTFYEIAESLEEKNAACKLFKFVLKRPMQKILENAGLESNFTLKTGEVYNVKTNVFEKNPIKNGLVDPVKVEVSALKNAASFAADFLTTAVALVDIKEKSENMV